MTGEQRARKLGRAERREALLDTAVELVVSGDLETVSMEAVAERAGVSRPLVYKHFADLNELLGAVYRREAAYLHEKLAAEVGSADTLEEMFRALIHGALRAAAERGHVFAALRAAGAWSRDIRSEQNSRDAVTVRAFSARAVRELGLDPKDARAATSMLLSLVDPVLAQWRRRPTRDHASLLEETYMTLVTGGLAALTEGCQRQRATQAVGSPRSSLT